MGLFGYLMENSALFIPAFLLAAAFVFYLQKRLLKELHLLQLNSYMNDRYLTWYRQLSQAKAAKRDFAAFLPLAAVFFHAPLALWLAVVIYLLLALRWRIPAEKKPLVMTARAKRLYGLALALTLIAALAALALCMGAYPWLGLLLLAVLTLFPLFIMLLANTLIAPLERHINNSFFRDAQRMLANMPRLTTVAITGSFGKTSSKMILGSILSREYHTLVSPGSYNTPMGLTRTIREQLRPIHEVFVAEMGAKQKGDIALLCTLVKPKIGILTAIGEQHLETFGSLETIIQTKFELIQALPPDGLAVLNFDNPHIRAGAALAPCPIIRYGLEGEWDYHAKDMSYDEKGLRFTLCAPGGLEQAISAPLLGRHNISNLLAAAAVAHSLGMSLEKIAREARLLAPVPHRLELRKNPGGYLIIDDAFNSNPAGAQAALEVLAGFKQGKKILITPGMVELGARQYQLNKEFALEAAKVCDTIILVGKNHTKPLQDGLTEAGFPAENTYIAADLNQALVFLKGIAAPGDVVLFENDLPDTYNEA